MMHIAIGFKYVEPAQDRDFLSSLPERTKEEEEAEAYVRRGTVAPAVESYIRPPLTDERRQQLRALASAVPPGPYQVQTSNSFRRIGTSRGDGDILCAIAQRSDRQPDLHAARGVLDLFAALDRETVLELLDAYDEAFAELQRRIEDLRATDEKYRAELEQRLAAVEGS
jgi:hypothetical protein